MLRSHLQLAVFLAASLAALSGPAVAGSALAAPLLPAAAFPGQEESRRLAAIERSALISGIPVPSVAGAPFSATAVIELQYAGSDDEDPVTLRTISLLARDSMGRTRRETRRLMPESFHGSPQLLTVLIYDPGTHMLTIYDPLQHIARQQVVHDASQSEDEPEPPDSKVRTEDLGPSTINGLVTHGTRRTRKIAEGRRWLGGSSVETELEEWHSQELHLNLLVRYTDPRLGTETIGLSNLKREEPPASSFEIPKGSKVLVISPNVRVQSGTK